MTSCESAFPLRWREASGVDGACISCAARSSGISNNPSGGSVGVGSGVGGGSSGGSGGGSGGMPWRQQAQKTRRIRDASTAGSMTMNLVRCWLFDILERKTDGSKCHC